MFIDFHECAHHQTGDLEKKPPEQNSLEYMMKESIADCVAAIRMKSDNIYMTNKEIEKLADLIAKLVIENMPEMKIEIVDDEQDWKFTLDDEEEEISLLTQLAKAMTELDFNLKNENYLKCQELQDQIKSIEKKLKNKK